MPPISYQHTEMSTQTLTLTNTPPKASAITAVLESRESQQVQVAMLAAKRFPRDEKLALDRILNSCSRETLASQALYSFARGGTDIAGPSIRLAECLAQQWGNMECGWREIDRSKDGDGVGVSTVEAYAWDMETNTRVPRAFTVRHWRDTKKGGYALTDERDIYELCANQAARRLRACILAVIPGDIVEEAVKQCDVTLAASADTGPDAQKKILKAFEPFKVSKAQIEKKIQRRLDSITAAQVITLRKTLASLKDGMSSPSDWFEEVAPEDSGKGPPDPLAKKAAEQPAAEPEAEPEAAVTDWANMPDQPWGDESETQTQDLM